MSSIDVVYAANMRPGDLYAGQYVPDAPTTHVQTFAAAHKLVSVEPFKDDEGRSWVHLRSAAGELSPARIVTECLVIRL